DQRIRSVSKSDAEAQTRRELTYAALGRSARRASALYLHEGADRVRARPRQRDLARCASFSRARRAGERARDAPEHRGGLRCARAISRGVRSLSAIANRARPSAAHRKALPQGDAARWMGSRAPYRMPRILRSGRRGGDLCWKERLLPRRRQYSMMGSGPFAWE